MFKGQRNPTTTVLAMILVLVVGGTAAALASDAGYRVVAVVVGMVTVCLLLALEWSLKGYRREDFTFQKSPAVLALALMLLLAAVANFSILIARDGAGVFPVVAMVSLIVLIAFTLSWLKQSLERR